MFVYRAYVQDPFSSKWYSFDDTKVEEVNEQTVWSQSRGGQSGSTSSAYCLMYLHHHSSSVTPPPVNGTINFHTITGFHPAIASLHPISSFYSAPSNKSSSNLREISDTPDSHKSGCKSPTLKSPSYLTKNNKTHESLPVQLSSSSDTSFPHSPFHPQTLLSTSPPLFSARNLLIDSPVLIPVSVKSLVDVDNRSFEDEILQWDLRIIQGIYNIYMWITREKREERKKRHSNRVNMDNASLTERVNTFISKYQAKIAAYMIVKKR